MTGNHYDKSSCDLILSSGRFRTLSGIFGHGLFRVGNKNRGFTRLSIRKKKILLTGLVHMLADFDRLTIVSTDDGIICRNIY
jgi:hypothetical protein